MSSFYPNGPSDSSGNPLAAVVTFKLYGRTSAQCSVEVSADPTGSFADIVAEDPAARATGYRVLSEVLKAVLPDMSALLG